MNLRRLQSHLVDLCLLSFGVFLICRGYGKHPAVLTYTTRIGPLIVERISVPYGASVVTLSTSNGPVGFSDYGSWSVCMFPPVRVGVTNYLCP